MANYLDKEGLEVYTNHIKARLNDKVDKVAGKGLSTEDYTTAEKTKLAGIEAGANNYTHPDTHPASMIVETSEKRFITQAELDKLAGLEAPFFKGQFVSEAALNNAVPTAKVGAYAYVDEGAGKDVVKYIWDSNDGKWVKQMGISTQLTPADVKTMYEQNANTNAFTDAEKTKLSGIAAGAQVNVLEGVRVNGTDLPITNKKVNVTVPNVGTLRTDATTAQTPSASESFSNNITLHKVSKTGNYNDLINKPTIPPGVVVVDNLTSTSSTQALSANMGRELNDTKLDKASVITIAEINALFA